MSNYRKHWDQMSATSPSRQAWMAAQPVVRNPPIKKYFYDGIPGRDAATGEWTVRYSFRKPGVCRWHIVRKNSPSHRRIERIRDAAYQACLRPISKEITQ